MDIDMDINLSCLPTLNVFIFSSLFHFLFIVLYEFLRISIKTRVWILEKIADPLNI